jgi:SEC-C motif-containing protein
MVESVKCPCGSKKEYSLCCGIAHSNILNVKTAEQLMRSRYSAFCMANGEYLHKSHHSTTRPKSKSERKEIVTWAKSVIWIKLEIIATSAGLENDDFGTVEFKAFYIENGTPGVIHEKSNFEKENEHWVYVDGTHW